MRSFVGWRRCSKAPTLIAMPCTFATLSNTWRAIWPAMPRSWKESPRRRNKPRQQSMTIEKPVTSVCRSLTPFKSSPNCMRNPSTSALSYQKISLPKRGSFSAQVKSKWDWRRTLWWHWKRTKQFTWWCMRCLARGGEKWSSRRCRELKGRDKRGLRRISGQT